MVEPTKIQMRPGLNRETTDYGNTGGWWDCNLVRWKTGTAQQMGGWQKYTASAMQGTPRSLFSWSTLNSKQYYATGTNLKYYLIQGNKPVDITPLRTTVTLGTDPFETGAASSTTITVTHTAHGATVNSFVTFSSATGPIDGIPASEFNAEHQITSIIDADSYTIEVTTGATAGSTAGGGASVSAAYQLNAGLSTSVYGIGWGTGGWGEDGWGEGSGTLVETDTLRLWTEDNYGEDLLINPRDGAIYLKDMTSVSARAQNLATLYPDGSVPIIARQIMVNDNDRHTIAFATNSEGSSTQDRLLARWSDRENVGLWRADTTTTAGELRFDGGSEFMKAVETTTEILVFTDVTLHSMRFLGAPLVFGQTRVGSNIKLIGPNAVVSTGSQTAWMANGRFQMYDGVVRDIPCGIRTYIFSILNKGQAEKIEAGVNRQYAEIIWLMPVNGSSENNFYVICNYEDWTNPLWYYGSFNDTGRTAWLDATFEDYPLAAAPDGYIYTHDFGATDNTSGTPAKLDSWLKSSIFELGSGGDFMLVSRIIPDVSFDGSSAASPKVNFTFEKKNYPGSAFVTGPDAPVTQTVSMPIEQYTGKVDKRFRARAVQIGIESDAAGTAWSLGVPRLYMAPDGKR